jgi:hypothetical protein
MKIRKVDGFKPIQITLETQEEASAMHACLYDAFYCNNNLGSHPKTTKVDMEDLFIRFLEVYKI